MHRPQKPTGPKPVETYRHDEKRANIPTNELRGFVEGDESAPSAMLYPRDPSLDPQLVWKGKDEQDARDLEVPVVPIYIQEKILPQVIIENLPGGCSAVSRLPKQARPVHGGGRARPRAAPPRRRPPCLASMQALAVGGGTSPAADGRAADGRKATRQTHATQGGSG